MGFWEDITGQTSADAARDAAADQYRKQVAAASGLKSYGRTLPGRYESLAKAYQPYEQAGLTALNQLMTGLGVGPGDAAAFTGAYRNLPGYQGGLETGTAAAQRALNAAGLGQSGRAAKELYRFGSNYEDQRAGDYLSRLRDLAGYGPAATGAAVGTRAQGLGAETGLQSQAGQFMYGAAPTIGQGDIAAAQAQQGAMTNLLGLGASLAGSAFGGPLGGAIGGGVGGMLKPQMPGYGPYPKMF